MLFELTEEEIMWVLEWRRLKAQEPPAVTWFYPYPADKPPPGTAAMILPEGISGRVVGLPLAIDRKQKHWVDELSDIEDEMRQEQEGAD